MSNSFGFLFCGVDLVDLRSFERAVVVGGQRFVHNVYTDKELRLCEGHVPTLAEHFAAKEAISKALGTGLRGMTWQEMEVLLDAHNHPVVLLSGNAAKRARELALQEWEIGFARSAYLVAALAIAYSRVRWPGSNGRNPYER